jgi:3-oxoacyl-[acyl-carrier-protein] synthase II
MALEESGRDAGEVDYINAHATATPVGDPNEVKAIIWALGEATAATVAVSSTKSMHGHCLGAAGGVETGLTALAIRNGRIPPTINLDRLDPACAGVDHVIGASRDATVDLALSNAFGFGGHNAVIALARYED